jgi:hypothetical protein
MNFWKALRWGGALLFVAIVLLAWASSGRNGHTGGDDDTRAVTPIMR